MTLKVVPFDTVIATADVPNKNGRIYTSEALQKAIDGLNNKACIGQLGMPIGPSYTNMAMCSHEVRDIRMVDGQMIGTVHVLETAEGTRMKALLSSCIPMFFRTSGTGDVDKDGVVTNFTIHSINAVADGA